MSVSGVPFRCPAYLLPCALPPSPPNPSSAALPQPQDSPIAQHTANCLSTCTGKDDRKQRQALGQVLDPAMSALALLPTLLYAPLLHCLCVKHMSYRTCLLPNTRPNTQPTCAGQDDRKQCQALGQVLELAVSALTVLPTPPCASILCPLAEAACFVQHPSNTTNQPTCTGQDDR